MSRFIVQRALSLFATLVTVSVVIFIIVRLLPGNIIDVLLRRHVGHARAEGGGRARSSELYGSWFHQYRRWIRGILLHGDFGNSYRSQQPISNILWHAIPITSS